MPCSVMTSKAFLLGGTGGKDCSAAIIAVLSKCFDWTCPRVSKSRSRFVRTIPWGFGHCLDRWIMSAANFTVPPDSIGIYTHHGLGAPLSPSRQRPNREHVQCLGSTQLTTKFAWICSISSLTTFNRSGIEKIHFKCKQPSFSIYNKHVITKLLWT